MEQKFSNPKRETNNLYESQVFMWRAKQGIQNHYPRKHRQKKKNLRSSSNSKSGNKTEHQHTKPASGNKLRPKTHTHTQESPVKSCCLLEIEARQTHASTIRNHNNASDSATAIRSPPCPLVSAQILSHARGPLTLRLQPPRTRRNDATTNRWNDGEVKDCGGRERAPRPHGRINNTTPWARHPSRPCPHTHRPIILPRPC